ncbi:hypothetical protein [Photobacterium chitinilyticum]|uniref:Uncharacterized protein n=1 Tax=Photobacterium chitinilyticum TaxID=2485123 RepID=A0A444JJ67_9GAMM|nr:hypothetical protein [Photobacterium chitinilyticum]RWX53110.1 hypothetical protein EDI28_23455 [Photobacterium chitinilyticum]
MVSDLLSVSIHQFKADCLQLCEQHYPTVHNRGMRGNHLGKTLCRRILSTLKQADIPAELHQGHHDDALEQPIFRIETPSFTLWIIAHHLVSANLARREALVQSVNTACQQIDEEKQHHLLIVSDHWFDRSKASKEIPAWWLGQLPTNTSDYLADGIRLQECAETLPECLQQKYLLSEGQHQIHHPLKRNGGDKIVHRYILLTAYYQIR